MNKQKFYLHQKEHNNLNFNHLSNQTQSFKLNDSQIMKLTTNLNEQNLKIINLIKIIDDSRKQQKKRFNEHYIQLQSSNFKQYNQEILNEIYELKQQFTNLEQKQHYTNSKQKPYNNPHLPPLQSLQFEQSNNEKSEQDNKRQNHDQKNRIMKSQSIYESQTQNQNIQLQKKKKSRSTKRGSQYKNSKNPTIKTEASPPLSSERIVSNVQEFMSRKTKRSQNPKEFLNHNQFQDLDRIHKEQTQKQNLIQNKYDQNIKRNLLRKFRAVSRSIWLALTFLKYCKRIWHQKQMIFKDWSQDLIGQYDRQFNYQLIMDKFYKECIIKRLVDKSWVFKSQFDIQIKCHNILIVLEIFFKNLIVQSLDFSIEHIKFIQQFSLKKGYLLAGHSRFVANRINIRPNNTLNITNHQQTQMIIMEYSYIQLLLPLIVGGEFWMRMTNYKEALKIFVSILHYLFIETFQNLPLIEQEIGQNKEWVPLFDFSKNPIDGFYQLINYQHPKYTENKDAVVLGLFSKVELHPIILHNGYKSIHESFKQYCNIIYSLII